MELTTGKNAENFEKWYINDYLEIGHAKNLDEHRDGMLGDFYCKRIEMQKGVYEAYYLSEGLEFEKKRFINKELEVTGRYEVCIYDYTLHAPLLFTIVKADVNEALTEALKQVDKLMKDYESI